MDQRRLAPEHRHHLALVGAPEDLRQELEGAAVLAVLRAELLPAAEAQLPGHFLRFVPIALGPEGFREGKELLKACGQ